MTSSDELLKESLSALMDNQASELELRRILKQLPEDTEIGATWKRYQLASTVLKRSETAFLHLDLTAAIAEAIANEPALSESAAVKKSASLWLRWGGKSALAASVAIAMLVGVQQLSAPTATPLAVAPSGLNSESPNSVSTESVTALSSIQNEGVLPESSQVQTAPNGFALPAPMARTVSSQADRVQSLQVQPVSLDQTDWRNDPEVQAQLNQMLLDHASRSAAHGSFGLLPFTRISAMPSDTALNSAAESAAGKN
jgi:sigma-E factor negative regulatory protein RseA